MTFRSVFSAIALGSLMTGCGYVGSNSLQTALCLLDEDGDGVPRGGESCGPQNDGDLGIEWVDNEGETRYLDGVILDCDDDPTVITDNEGNQHVKGQLRTPFTVDIPYDGIDNDCDGTVDESFANIGLPCDGEDLDTCLDGVWICNNGAEVCDDDGEAQPELCNGADDDCDGADDFAVG